MSSYDIKIMPCPYLNIVSESVFPAANENAAVRKTPHSRLPYFFMYSLTIFSTSSGVSTGLAISFLGQTAAHRPQEVHFS